MLPKLTSFVDCTYTLRMFPSVFYTARFFKYSSFRTQKFKPNSNLFLSGSYLTFRFTSFEYINMASKLNDFIIR